MATRLSKRVLRYIKDDPRFGQYYIDSDGHWVDLAVGWKIAVDETTMFHECTAAELLRVLKEQDSAIIRGEC